MTDGRSWDTRSLDLEAEARRQFEQATLPHLDAAYNLARWLTQDEHAAEDVVQEAYYRAARYFASFRGGDGRAWLLGVVRRASYDWLEKRRAQAAVLFNEDAHDPRDDSSNPALLAIRASDQACVHKALAELPVPLREAIVLRELEGLSYQQIAAVADIPIGTVMSRLARARQQLQRLLASYAESESEEEMS
ncbi:RNA polymerase subunit sigma [Planctomycetaceae bacterium SCGC AG-212-F19]|nr:RNA polymerase subunit sigma [Planctomycetaceae bacterium SCGC AG-212-F19]